MTRKDYILIAQAIINTQQRIRAYCDAHPHERRNDGEYVQLRGVRRTAAHLADAFTADNPTFDAARFLTACGYGATGGVA